MNVRMGLITVMKVPHAQIPLHHSPACVTQATAETEFLAWILTNALKIPTVAMAMPLAAIMWEVTPAGANSGTLD